MSSVLQPVLMCGFAIILRGELFGDEVVLVVEGVVGAATEESDLALNQAERLLVHCLLLESRDCL